MHTHHATHAGSVSRIGSGSRRWRQSIVALTTVTLGVVATACGSDTEAGNAATDESAAASDNAPASTDDTDRHHPVLRPTTEPVTDGARAGGERRGHRHHPRSSAASG